MLKNKVLLRSWKSDSCLYQPLSKRRGRNKLVFTLPIAEIPKLCKKDLIFKYLNRLETLNEGLILAGSVSEGQIEIYSGFLGPHQKDLLSALEKYIQLGKLLDHTSKTSFLIAGTILAIIAIGALAVVLLFSFTSGLISVIPAIAIALLIMAIPIAAILLCSRVAGYRQISALQQAFHNCEQILNEVRMTISDTVDNNADASPRHLVNDTAALDNTQNNLPINRKASDPIAITPWTSACKSQFFHNDRGATISPVLNRTPGRLLSYPQMTGI